ncbi:hypothetical protein HDV04_000809 [Boothiomyces sp. JEL0838]|nr:hypothetical protein HDV04_000809 [Boothiomyces sp. JEL0838]
MNYAGSFNCCVYQSKCQNNTVTELKMPRANMNGQIPAELGQLKSLTLVDLSYNPFGSAGLPDLSSLTNLQALVLNGTRASGHFPTWITKLSQLEILNLGDNQLQGAIPDLSALSTLKELHLGVNQFSSLPDISKLSNLELLAVCANNLSGPFPDLMSNLKLKKIYLCENTFSGALPDLNKLIALEEVFLNNNSLSGAIPDISRLTHLKYFVIGQNQFTGLIPDMKPLQLLEQVDFSDNPVTGFKGAFEDFKLLPNFNGLGIARTLLKLDGFPDWLLNIDMIYVDLDGINFGMDLFPTILKWKNMESLSMSNCGLTGPVPSDIAKLENLFYFNVSGNSLTGTIPKEISYLSSLDFIDLSNNQLSGDVPKEILNMERYQSSNYLFGNQSSPPSKSHLMIYVIIAVLGCAAIGGLAFFVLYKKRQGNQVYPLEQGFATPEPVVQLPITDQVKAASPDEISVLPVLAPSGVSDQPRVEIDDSK